MFHILLSSVLIPFSCHLSWRILLLGVTGIACGIFSGTSCKWFEWTPLPDDLTWGVFRSDPQTNQATSIGLFRFFPSDTNDADEQQPIDFFSSQCHPYNSYRGIHSVLIARETDPWMFTAQLCFILATVLACVALIDLCSYLLCRPLALEVVPYCTSKGWLLASGLQAASCMAATALCGGYSFWSCPWLQGAHASAGAAWFYLLCWLLSICGSRLINSTGNQQTVHHHYHHHHYHPPRSVVRKYGRADAGLTPHDFLEGGMDYRMTTGELLGANDPVILRALGQKADTIREFAVSQQMEDFWDDEQGGWEDYSLPHGIGSSIS